MLSCEAPSLIRDNELHKLYCNLKRIRPFVWNLFNSYDDTNNMYGIV